MTDNYSLWEKKGRSLQAWIEDYRAAGCPYPISTFVLTPRHRDYFVDRTSVHLDARLLTALNMGNVNSTYWKISITQRDEGPPVWWIGRTGPGVIFIDDIFRSKRSDDPYMSEVIKAAYKMDFSLDSLRTVFVSNVNEKNTLSCTWKPSSPEFNALLGIGIGKVVAASVLCAWGQGRKRIARIVTVHIGADIHKLYMRFNLENM
ncbi:uncharacterized protein N7479_007330 [Penicillium vulpinum]|uniref:uncharacterized protein n=1 Tax=Penicillium vulpinum TaxID=29845 RepID=UPI00254977C2|nr:uncharacterized protein N7479_007330 [Penicillium vulpinum]KAJ5960180.1 hypothetical protein N7479_007330 [Penicillium vulpinum]